MTNGSKMIKVLELKPKPNPVMNSEQYCTGVTDPSEEDRKPINAIPMICKAPPPTRIYKGATFIFETRAPEETPANGRDIRRGIR